jgi:uncharacterized coiled-coil protein SlyX
MSDLSFIKEWLSVVATGGVIASFILINWLRGQFTSVERFETAAKKIEILEDRVSKTEGQIEHLPDRNTAHRMEMAIARLEGRFEILDERLKPVSAMASRMQDYLMDEARAPR